jgi:hypothetical protein
MNDLAGDTIILELEVETRLQFKETVTGEMPHYACTSCTSAYGQDKVENPTNFNIQQTFVILCCLEWLLFADETVEWVFRLDGDTSSFSTLCMKS